VVQAAVHRSPCALAYASDDLQNDLRCLMLYLHRCPRRDETFASAREPAPMPTGCTLAEDEAVARIAAWLQDWRAMEALLVGIHAPHAPAPPCAVAMLHTGDGAIARRVAGYVGTPGRFVGVRSLRVVDACEAVVRGLSRRMTGRAARPGSPGHERGARAGLGGSDRDDGGTGSSGTVRR